MTGELETALQIQASFAPLFAAAGRPADMAVFSSATTRKTIFHFSPGASALAKKFGATVCDKPNRDQLGSLLAGVPAAWKIHFPSP
jgi:hypothetical protein